MSDHPSDCASLPSKPPKKQDEDHDNDRELSPPRKRTKVKDTRHGRPLVASNETSSMIPPASSSRFVLQPLNRFQGASASIKRPREIAHFSYDNDHQYEENESGINYYCPPKLGADLCEGFETFKLYEDKDDPHLDSLLKALMSREKTNGEKVQADFVTWRGMMTKIMTAPFDIFAEFDMFATLHDGTIYIEEDFNTKAAERSAEANRPPPNRHYNSNQPSREMMTYWGYKFEALSLLSDTAQNTPRSVIEDRPKVVVSNHAQHCSIVRTAFGPHSLILGGEVDGLWQPKSLDPNAPIPWVELKTSEELPRYPQDRDILKFERKLLKFWAQSFLLGVEKVIVGFRSKQGVLRNVDIYDTAKIPGMVRRGSACWDGNMCINFATAFLTHLQETIVEDGIYKIQLKKKSGVIDVVKVQEQGTGSIVSEDFLAWRGQKEDPPEGSGTEPA